MRRSGIRAQKGSVYEPDAQPGSREGRFAAKRLAPLTSTLAAMKKRARLQARLDAAFHNYLKLTALLHEDLEAMLSTEETSLHWRRNFVRASAALLEGHAHCLRQMCVVGLECDAPTITTKGRRRDRADCGVAVWRAARPDCRNNRRGSPVLAVPEGWAWWHVPAQRFSARTRKAQPDVISNPRFNR